MASQFLPTTKYSDALTILLISIITAFICEFISYLLIYRTTSYKSLKSAIDKSSKKLETMKTPPKLQSSSSSSASKSSKTKKIDRVETSLKDASHDLSMFKLKSGEVVALALFMVFGFLNSLFEGKAVTKIPFVSIKLVQKMSHRNLPAPPRGAANVGLFPMPDQKMADLVIVSRIKIYIILYYITGGELFDEILHYGRLSEVEARRYFQQLIDGVECCHNKGLYHRDLKPENSSIPSVAHEGNKFERDVDAAAVTVDSSIVEEVQEVNGDVPKPEETEEVNGDVPKPEETVEERKEREREEKFRKEKEERRRIREQKEAEEAKKMTLAQYEKIRLEKKQALNIQKSEVLRVVAVDEDLENMKLVSKKQEKDEVLIVEKEKPKDKVGLDKQIIADSTMSHENKNEVKEVWAAKCLENI